MTAQKHFQKIGLFAKYNASDDRVTRTFEQLTRFLAEQEYHLSIEKNSAKLLPNSLTKQIKFTTIDQTKLGEDNDLVIVLGGDGSLLNAARSICHTNTPILGINRGRLGFLADITPETYQQKLSAILNGEYAVEQRDLLQASIVSEHKVSNTSNALNDAVLYTSDVARMLEFEVFINQQFVLRQRADGIIISTPTGSTAYALSSGGPILYPTIPAFSLVPMLPHTLTSRPIVVDNNSDIVLVVTADNSSNVSAKLSLDGQVHMTLKKGDEVHIRKHDHTLSLLHPTQSNYFELLRKKLGWSTHTTLTSDRVARR